MRKITILFLFPVFCAAQNLEQINTATGNAIELIKIFKKDKDAAKDSSAKQHQPDSKTELCSNFCILNKNKGDARVIISSKLAADSIEIMTIGGGQSCYFDIPLGTYFIEVYLDNQLKIKTQFKIRDTSGEVYTIPE